ncbi:uncharacterized protein LOC105182023 [Harpegnathos saltator]|uniref:uncharacterized protein LOC105182023 n=1 Tax=Harpegnathos saltator TaxID=610380 RepID=UPI0009491D60|nr:uncharacterized protein LOC105182023 [Harpegnathos saltator]
MLKSRICLIKEIRPPLSACQFLSLVQQVKAIIAIVKLYFCAVYELVKIYECTCEKTMMRCTKFKSNKKLHLNVEEGTDNATKTTNTRINGKNDNSPKSCRDYIAPINHSTPVKQKPSLNNTEESPNVDYPASPLTIPCTQDGGNEVAWDWQNTLNKTPNRRTKKQNIQSETPKGTKSLQRKRNSDSPLLCKSFKRKTINMERTENIGQFRAELQALSEKIGVKKPNDQHDLDDCIKEESIIMNTSHDEEEAKSSVTDNKENYGTKTNSHNNISKKSSSYDDLFDDSIDDSMARCTQEIEEMFNLIIVKGNSIVCPQKETKKGKSPTSNTVAKISPIQSKENSVATVNKSLFLESTSGDNILKTNSDSTLKTNGGSILKTYSRLPLKKDANSSTRVVGAFSPWKDKELHKLCLNNNMVHCDTEKSCDDKKSSKDSAAELLDFPDDSFDDCLATCIEDDKLPSTSTKFNSFLPPKIQSSYKTLTNAPLKGKLSYCTTISKTEPTTKEKMPTAGPLDNRKFFKSKSLSEQYINQNSIVQYKNTAHVTFPSYSTKSASHLSSLPKCSAISYHKNVVAPTSVSINSIATKDRYKNEHGANSLMTSADRTLRFDVNKSTAKEGGNRFVKHNSTGNMRNDTKELAKFASLTARCTAGEIERKRLQAKMRLEAKQKLYAVNVKNNINR